MANDYARTQRVIAALPHKELTRGSAISARNWLLANYTPNLARRNLVQISACCSWGVNSGFIDFNPFQGLAKEIKLKRITEKNLGFSREERDIIISAFEDSKPYKFYAPFVKFLFLTGCRPSEAIALTWSDISDKFIRLHQAAVDTPKGILIKPGLKTQQERRFPINSQLSDLLKKIRTDTQNPKHLVFSGINGGIINFRNFCQRVWKVVLSTLAIDYQHPYTCRHTFISLCLMSDVGVKDIAGWVGNSPEIIYRHYVRDKINLEVPEL
ncbi:MAG: site-specific integrase [Potamolinea sp.]